MYQLFFAKANEARKRSARFFRVDLHLHSYESDDFPGLGHKAGCATALSAIDKSASTADFVAAGKRAGLRLMAVTDHNKSKVAEQIASLSDDELVILPGMEVSVKTSFFPDSVVHILTIFPEKYGNADIERLFARGGMPIYAERSHESVLDLQVHDLIKTVHDLGGCCIASHVNSDKGLRSLFRESNTKLLRLEMRKRELQRRQKEGILSSQESAELLKLSVESKAWEDEMQNQYLSFLAEHEFDAVEVQRSLDRQFYSGTHVDDLGIRPIPCVIGSDAHNLSDIGLKGYSTYIKMTQPGFADLRKALRDPGTRIRFEDDVPRPPAARILGIQFDGGFFLQHTIGFSDNLTCLIGGRGSGKSATIEALRYVFAHSVEHLHKDKQSDIQARLQYTLEEADVKVVFQDPSGDSYVLKRRYDDVRTGCFELDGAARPEIDVAIASNFQAKIFGWGEIEELARSKRDQLSLIDGFIPEVKERKERVQDSLRALKDNTNKMVNLAEEIRSLLPRVAELSTKRALLSKLDSEVLNLLFRDYDRNQQAQGAVESARLSVDELMRLFVQFDGSPHSLETQLREKLRDTRDRLSGYDWADDFQTQFLSLATNIQVHYQNLLAEFERLLRLIAEAEAKLEIEEASIEADLNRAAEEAETADAKSMLARRKALTEEVNGLQAIQDQIDQKQQLLQEHLQDRWARIVPELQLARRRVTQLRRSKLAEINSRLRALTATAKVGIRLLHQKERREFMLALGTGVRGDPEGILKRIGRHYISDKYAELYSQRHSPHTFVKAVLDPSDGDLVGLRARVTEEDGSFREVITWERASGVKRHLHPGLEDNGLYFDPDKLLKLLELEHCDTDDLVQISLDDRPIEELSPGQRCSALIPIVLLESNCPLVIDQPEDNLDNKLVFSLVVDIIRGLKEKRQIVVATHNPNIPVSGDAEQIVVFDAPTRLQCEQIIQGSIDCEDIVEQVKEIMEGSEEAFRIRAEKYGYRIPVKPVRNT